MMTSALARISVPELLHPVILQNLIVCQTEDEKIIRHAKESQIPKLYIKDLNFPFDAVTMFLRHNPVGTLHIMCPGRKGAIKFGNVWVTTSDLLENSLLISRWKVKRIALWCSQTGAYPEFCETLSRLTGAEVFSTTSIIFNYGRNSGVTLFAGENELGIECLTQSK